MKYFFSLSFLIAVTLASCTKDKSVPGLHSPTDTIPPIDRSGVYSGIMYDAGWGNLYSYTTWADSSFTSITVSYIGTDSITFSNSQTAKFITNDSDFYSLEGGGLSFFGFE